MILSNFNFFVFYYSLVTLFSKAKRSCVSYMLVREGEIRKRILGIDLVSRPFMIFCGKWIPYADPFVRFSISCIYCKTKASQNGHHFSGVFLYLFCEVGKCGKFRPFLQTFFDPRCKGFWAPLKTWSKCAQMGVKTEKGQTKFVCPIVMRHAKRAVMRRKAPS